MDERDGRITFWIPCMGLVIHAEPLGEGQYLPYISQQASSWHWSGERSDIVDTSSFALAAYLQKRGIASYRFFDADNGMGWDLPELHHRFLIPVQPINASHEMTPESMGSLLSEIHEFGALMHLFLPDYCPANHGEEDDLDFWPNADHLAGSLNSGLPEVFDLERDGHSTRETPDIKYYRTHAGDISVTRNKGLASFMRNVTAQENAQPFRRLPGIDGDFIISGEIQNFIPGDKIGLIGQIAAAAGESQIEPESIVTIPFENAVLGVTQEHAILLEASCGRYAFNEAREALAVRRQAEADFLFSPSGFTWSERIDGQAFEDMVRDLLSCTSWISWVRGAGPARERDGGRDLIIGAAVADLPNHSWSQSEANVNHITAVVQCKAHAKTVGSSDVREIRDAIEDAGARGFLLVVSSRVSSSLTTRLQHIRDKNGYWTDWWDRKEVEALLRKNPDILARYPEIVKPSN
ncbi:restriction endonuclease [Streptodolium elevatio]